MKIRLDRTNTSKTRRDCATEHFCMKPYVTVRECTCTLAILVHAVEGKMRIYEYMRNISGSYFRDYWAAGRRARSQAPVSPTPSSGKAEPPSGASQPWITTHLPAFVLRSPPIKIRINPRPGAPMSSTFSSPPSTSIGTALGGSG
jgi:hypothetical protein